MSEAFIRWTCAACHQTHTRRVTPDADGALLVAKTFPSRWRDLTDTRVIDRPGDLCYRLPVKVDLTCDGFDVVILDEEAHR